MWLAAVARLSQPRLRNQRATKLVPMKSTCSARPILLSYANNLQSRLVSNQARENSGEIPVGDRGSFFVS